jgi:hypothetical protein
MVLPGRAGGKLEEDNRERGGRAKKREDGQPQNLLED